MKPGKGMDREIRLLKAGDEGVLERVAPDVFDDEVRGESTAEFLRDPRHHLAVVVSNGVVIGFASAVTNLHPGVGTEPFNAAAMALYCSFPECGPPGDFVMFEFKL